MRPLFGGGGAKPAEPTEKSSSPAPCRVVSIFSPKGGVGKTLIAANLAAELQGRLANPTALIELDAIRRDASMLLGSSGVVCVPDVLTSHSLPAKLDELRSRCAFIFIDAGGILNALSVTAFEQSNLILIVATPDLVAVRHTQETLERLEALKFPLRMVRIVLNRAESQGHLRSRDVREHLEVEVLADIPSDGKRAGLSVNRGIPLVLDGDGGRIKEALQHLAKSLLERPELYVEHCPTVDYTKLPAAPAEGLAVLTRPDALGLGAASPARDPITDLKHRVHAKLIERFDLKRLDLKTLNDPQKAQSLRQRAEAVSLELLDEEGGFVESREQRQRLVKEIVDEALGLGPLEELLEDQTVSDILVNGTEQIYVERRGKLLLTDKRFSSNDQLLAIIERIISPLGRRIDESTPMVDARLPDGSRVNAIIPPLSLKGAMLSIRKFTREKYGMRDLLGFGSLDERMAVFLETIVKARKNIIISGGTGSGKTTLLNILSASILPQERIITIEDAAELQLLQAHWIPLEARPPNIEGRGAVTIRQLFHNALRMRPDRIIIGECRGEETLDMLQAMNTGHDGSLTTIHANSPQDVITRLDSLVLMSNIELPVRSIREQIVSAIHLILHTARLSDGSRKITHISELTGLDEHDNVTFGDVFLYRQQGMSPTDEVQGTFQATGYLPSFLEELKAGGLPVSESMFKSGEGAEQ